MRTIQMTLDEDLVDEVDAIARELETTRSAFTREALREAVRQHRIRRLEIKHRQGYEAHPVEKNELDIWRNEQKWGDE